MSSLGILVPLMGMTIPIVAILSRPLKRFIDFKERQLEVTSADTAEKAAQYAAKIERLEQRVAVLERIITDRSTALADEIERRSVDAEYRDHAVLCSGNDRLTRIGRELERRGIPVLYLGNLFERPEIKDLLSILSLLVDRHLAR